MKRMKIYNSEAECLNAAKAACDKNNLPYTEIREGWYKGGQYDCYYVITNEEDSKVIFECAFR